jgi:hypothetical protein
MSEPSQLKKKWDSRVAIAVISVVATAIVTVPVTLVVTTMSTQQASENTAATNEAKGPTAETSGLFTEGDQLTEKGKIAFKQANEGLKDLTKGSLLEACVDSDTSILSGIYGRSEYSGRPYYAKSPDDASMHLMFRCGASAVKVMLDTALQITPDPYPSQSGYGIPLKLTPISSREHYSDFKDCYANTESDADAGAKCVLDRVNELETNAPKLVAASNAEAREAWSNKWTQPPTSPEVVEATNLLRPILEAQPGASAQTRLDLEVCKTKGAWQDAALRLAVNRQMADFDQEPGIAANTIYSHYFKNEYGKCTQLG